MMEGGQLEVDMGGCAKIRSHLGPCTQVSGRLREAKPEAKTQWRCSHSKSDNGGVANIKVFSI